MTVKELIQKLSLYEEDQDVIVGSDSTIQEIKSVYEDGHMDCIVVEY